MSGLVYTPVPSVIPFFTAEEFISLIVGPVGCVAGGTLVLTEFGPIPIADIDRPMRVLSMNETTGQLQLSWCAGAFPKGKDYLHRVTTPEGEFDAYGYHRIADAHGKYRHIQSLRPGDGVKTYSGDLQATISGLCQLESHADALRSQRTLVDFLERCVELDRQYGQHALWEADNAQDVAPAQGGAQRSALYRDQSGVLRMDDRLVQLLAHSHLSERDDQSQIDDLETLHHHLDYAVEGQGASEFFSRVLGLAQLELQFESTNEPHRLPQPQPSHSPACLSPHSYSSTERPIVTVDKREEKEVFWDLHVHGTHNYVTVDGIVHHNSTKTTAGILKILYHASRMAQCRDGIRRSRCVWVRNTREQLRDTSIPDFLKWFPDGQAGTFAKTDYKYLLKMGDIECEVLFRGLDDTNDVRRLLSLQASFAVFDEFREINKDVFEAMQGRLGRYPDGMMVPHRPSWGVDDKGNPIQGCVTDDGKPNDHLWGMSNPPDFDTFWEKILTDPPENTHVTIQPSGLSEEADWIHLLKSNYYDNLMQGKTEEYIDVYIHAKFGKSLAGQPVYKSSFTREFHVAKDPLEPIMSPDYPIIIGLDFGRTPSAIFKQRDPRGRVMTLSEVTATNMGIETFIELKLMPHITNHYPGFDFVCAPDPAGFMKQQMNELTLVDALKAAGFRCVKPPTNKPEYRIQAVERLLGRQVEGKAMYLIDPRCTTLIKGFVSGYRYRQKRNGILEDAPEKNEYSHPHDANQYADLVIDMNIRGVGVRSGRREVKRVSYAYS
jgi:hypothetical protein